MAKKLTDRQIKINEAKRVAREKEQAFEDLISAPERAIEKSTEHRGYHIEKLKGGKGKVFVRRLVAARTDKLLPVIYELGEFDNMDKAKRAIAKAAKKFGREINEYDIKMETLDGTIAPKINYNQALKDAKLWKSGMQFLNTEEKKRLLSGDEIVYKILEAKLKAIAAKARSRK